MTIRREPKQPIIVSCDGCGEVHRNNLQGYPRFNYKAVWAAATADGWTARKTDDGKDWNHLCAACNPVV